MYAIRRADGSFHEEDQGYLHLSDAYRVRVKHEQIGFHTKGQAEGWKTHLATLGVNVEGWTVEEVE